MIHITFTVYFLKNYKEFFKKGVLAMDLPPKTSSNQINYLHYVGLNKRNYIQTNKL